MYAPSKGFRKYDGVNYWAGQSLLPRELGFSACTLANPDGVSEPEGLRYILGFFSDGTPVIEADPLLSKRQWARLVSGLLALHTPAIVKVAPSIRQLERAVCWNDLIDGLRALVDSQCASYGQPMNATEQVITGRLSALVSGLQALNAQSEVILNVITLENKLSSNAQKAAKHRVSRIVASRAERLLATDLKIQVSVYAKTLIERDASLDPMRAIKKAEEHFSSLAVEQAKYQYSAGLRLMESRGEPSYQYATPRYDAHCLMYQLQDNSKSRTISKGNGFRRIVKTA